MKKTPKPYVLYIGIVIFALGLLLQFLLPENDGALEALPYVMIGFGAGIIGVGAAITLRKRALDKDPEKAKAYEVAERDERNVALREKAGYVTWHITLFVLAILSLTFVVLNYWLACWLTMGALAIHIVSFFIGIYEFNKKL